VADARRPPGYFSPAVPRHGHVPEASSGPSIRAVLAAFARASAQRRGRPHAQEGDQASNCEESGQEQSEARAGSCGAERAVMEWAANMSFRP